MVYILLFLALMLILWNQYRIGSLKKLVEDLQYHVDTLWEVMPNTFTCRACGNIFEAITREEITKHMCIPCLDDVSG